MKAIDNVLLAAEKQYKRLLSKNQTLVSYLKVMANPDSGFSPETQSYARRALREVGEIK